MAARPARRGAWVLAVLLLGGALFITLIVVAAGVPVSQFRAASCNALASVVSLDHVLSSCSGPARASRELADGHAAAHRRAFREALGHYRAAAAAAPDLPAAHVARGELAEIIGEYEEALAAFQRAAVIAPSPDASLRVGAVAERLGRVDIAVQTLESANAPWRRHAAAGARVALARFATCAPMYWTNPLRLWHTCVTGSRDAYGSSFDASRAIVPRGIFRILVEDGRREQALAFAREHGWVRDDVEYCGRHALPIDSETSALLALLTQPDRADCAVSTALHIADDGGARLARIMLIDRITRSPQAETRERAQYVLRYRLPDHNVPRLAEALNATGWRLHHLHDAADEALVVFQKAIDVDPRFSWPHHNIARIYMARADYEQARIWLERALTVNPDHWRALYNYGVTNANLKRWPDALNAYRKALAISPNDARLHANVGWTLIELGQHIEADRELQIAVRLDPSLHTERAYLNSRYGSDARSGPTPTSSR
jgi:tetratricopeptide (TPR) repeat protein